MSIILLNGFHNCCFPKCTHKVPSCVDDILYTLSQSRGHEMLPVFVENYSFSYRKFSSPYYRGIEVKDNSRLLLSRFLGIHSSLNSVSNNSVERVILQELQKGNPIAVHFDAFFCPWDNEYNKRHNTHMVLITGFDSSERKVFLCDPWWDKECWLSIDVLNPACSFYMLFSFEKTDAPSIDDCFFLFHIEKMLSLNTIFDDIRGFGKDIAFYYDCCDLDGDSFYTSHYQFLLQKVLYSRCKYHSFLEYIQPKSEIITEQTCLKFKEFVLSWRIVQQLLAKAYIQKATRENDVIKHISQKVISIADAEERFFYQLLHSSHSNILSITSNNSATSAIQKTTVIDLSRYLNNKAFDTISGQFDANITGKHSFFLIDDFISNKTFYYKDISIPLIEHLTEKYDNIICLGQEIPFSESTFSRVVICGFCDFGSYTDYLKWSDTKNNVYIMEIKMPDFFSKQIEGFTILFEGNTFIKKGETIRPHRGNGKIYIKDIALKNTISANKLILPYCPGIHIFSIILT